MSPFKKHIVYSLLITILLPLMAFSTPLNQVEKDIKHFGISNLGKTNFNSKDYSNYEVSKLVELEQTPASHINQVKEVIVLENRLIVIDPNLSIYIFSMEGEFLNCIGEIQFIGEQKRKHQNFYIDRKKATISLYYQKENLVVSYRINGEVLSQKKVKPTTTKIEYPVLLDNNKVLYNKAMTLSRTNPVYSLFDLEKEERIKDFFTYHPIKTQTPYYKFATHPISIVDREIKAILPLCDTIYSYTNLEFSPKYIIESPSKRATKEMIEENTISYDKESYRLGEEGYFTGFTAIFETQRHLLLEAKMSGLDMGFYLVDKSKELGNYFIYTLKDPSHVIPFYPIVGSTENYFIGSSTLIDLDHVKWKLPKRPSINREFMELINKRSSKDNPILLFYSIK